MQRTETTTRTLYYSRIHAELVTSDRYKGEVIEWADENPVVWEIVRGTKSKPFGKNSSEYVGSGRDDSPESVLYRMAHLKYLVDNIDPLHPAHTSELFWQWRAQFTIAHYHDKNFRGGFFQQWDGSYDRMCAHLDYTPATLDEVVGKFVEWCSGRKGIFGYETKEVRIDGVTVAQVAGGKIAIVNRNISKKEKIKWPSKNASNSKTPTKRTPGADSRRQ